MEVHHHPHIEKENFKKYFLEFLIIFLAISMGFIRLTCHRLQPVDSKKKNKLALAKQNLNIQSSKHKHNEKDFISCIKPFNWIFNS